MATYKSVKGYKVQSRASDPTVNEGQIWYNTASNALKYDAVGAGAWSAGTDMNTGREGGGTGFGTQTAGVAIGGAPSPKAVEEYNGIGWTTVTDIPTAVVGAGTTGSQVAGLAVGVFSSTKSMSYNGSTWTELATYNTPRTGGIGVGTQTAALYIGSPGNAATEEYNGTAWTTVGPMQDSRGNSSGGGVVTAAMVCGGWGGSPSTNPTATETYNGASWTEVAELNSGRAYLTGGGDTNDSITFGGGPYPGVTTKTEKWNGTGWTEVAAMANASETAFGTMPGAGSLTYRAGTPASGVLTEEWDNSPTVVKTVTVS
jgi:hypothetical protein